MANNIVFIFMFLVATNIANAIKPKFCHNCKYFVANGMPDKFGKCSLFPIISKDDYYLVTGVNEARDAEYSYCSTARSMEHMCGEEGALHVRKYVRTADRII